MSNRDDIKVNQVSNGQHDTRDRSAKMALGLAIGLALGVSLGVALDSIPIGIAVGAGVGVSLAMAFSGKRQEPSRPLIIAGIVLMLLGIFVFAVLMSLVLPQWWCGYPILNLLPGC
jgi:hypothetical protein